ncbi:interferon lambda receptor 1 [Scomber scombrus]|uniref:Interferon lambda receptor 1 n=1 Tax=Scomber scombrus TaxID=13677 RepID=A0AAV1NYF8_SCOSC
MKMWSMNVIILLLFCYACLSTANEKVCFISKNFHNVLHWDPAKPAFTGEKILYSVQYLSYDKEQRSQIKRECQNITALSCDLTAETPSFHDVHYLARVFVNGRLHGRTKRFKPLAHTTFGPPILSTFTTVSSLHVRATLPLGPNGVSIEDIITHSKTGQTLIEYTLKITSPKWAIQDLESTSGQFVVNLKNNQTKFCGYVVYKPSSERGRPESQNASFCDTLKEDHERLLPWPLMSVALLLAVILISVVCSYIYVKRGKGRNMPQSLVTNFDNLPKVLRSPDRNLILSKPVVCTQSDQTVEVQAKPNVTQARFGGYSPQDIPHQLWQDSTGSSDGTGVHSPMSNQQDTSAHSSEIYSSVAVHVPAEDNEDLQQVNMEDRKSSDLPLSSNRDSWDKSETSPKLISHGAVPLPNLDACESDPLLLQTERDINGQLILPSFTFQLQSTTDGTESPTKPERKPLLSDLIVSENEGPSLASLQRLDSSEWSDSGCDDSSVNTPTQFYCNTYYFPNQPVVPDSLQRQPSTPCSDGIFESGYKQKWVPAIVLETTAKDNCEYSRINFSGICPKKEEEGEEDEDSASEEASGQIFLDDWVVQIQE